MGKSFGFVDIDIARKNISISADIGGGWGILSTKGSKSGIPETFLTYPQPLAGSQIYQNKTDLGFISKYL